MPMNMPPRLQIVLLAMLAIILNGCGGGGGGGGGIAKSVLTVVTDWSNHGATGGGLSERLDLLDSNGLLVQELIANQAPGLPTTVFTSVPAGTYHLSAQLWSQ